MFWLFLVSIIWAFSFGLIKNQLSGLHPNLVVFLRLLISLVVFLPFLKWRKIPWQMAGRLCLTGSIQYGLMYIAYQYAFNYLKSYEVALFTIFTPLYVALFHRLVNPNLSGLFVVTAVLAVVGTGLAEWQSLPRLDVWWGFLIVQASNLCFAFGQLFYKRVMNSLPGVKDHQVFGWLYLGGVLVASAGLFTYVDLGSVLITFQQWTTLIYLGAVASGLCFFLWNFGARQVNNGALAIFNNLKVPLAMTVSVVVFREQAEIIQLALGGAIVLLALLLNEFWPAIAKAIFRQKTSIPDV